MRTNRTRELLDAIDQSNAEIAQIIARACNLPDGALLVPPPVANEIRSILDNIASYRKHISAEVK